MASGAGGRVGRPRDTARGAAFEASPTKIKTYLQCPARYFYKYEKRSKGVQVPSHALIRGNALHNLMRRVMKQVNPERMAPDDIYPLAVSVTSAMEYPEEFEKAQVEDTLEIVRWSSWALGQLGGEVRVLDVERDRLRMLQGAVLGRQIMLRSRLDAVVERPDGAIEHIDYKTGRVKPDPVQDLISRTVIGSVYGPKRRIKTTSLFVAHQHKTSRELNRDEMRPIWLDVKRAIRATATRKGPWEPQPSALCEWCPYCDICPAYK